MNKLQGAASTLGAVPVEGQTQRIMARFQGLRERHQEQAGSMNLALESLVRLATLWYGPDWAAQVASELRNMEQSSPTAAPAPEPNDSSVIAAIDTVFTYSSAAMYERWRELDNLHFWLARLLTMTTEGGSI